MVYVNIYTRESHNFTVWSIAAEANTVPAQCQVTPQTGCWWSDRVWMQLVSFKSHTLTEPSPELVAKEVPSGWKCTADSQSECPSPLINNSPLHQEKNNSNTWLWYDVCMHYLEIVHSFQVWSSLAVATTGLWGWMSTAVAAWEWACTEREGWNPPVRVKWVHTGSWSVSWYLLWAGSGGKSRIRLDFGAQRHTNNVIITILSYF